MLTACHVAAAERRTGAAAPCAVRAPSHALPRPKHALRRTQPDLQVWQRARRRLGAPRPPPPAGPRRRAAAEW